MESVAGVFVPAEVLAREQETTAEDVVQRIQSGELVGRKQSNGWHVMVRVPESAQTQQQAPTSAPDVIGARAEVTGPITIDGVTEVVVRDVQIRFTAMVILILKFVLACIPVGIILGAVALVGSWLYGRFGAQIESFLQLGVDFVTSLIQ